MFFSQKSCDLLFEIPVCGGCAVSYKEKAEFFAPLQVCVHDFGEGREVIYKQFVAKIFGDKGHYFQKKIVVGHGYSVRYNIADEFLFFARGHICDAGRRNGEKVRFMALSAKVFTLTVLVGFHGFFDCDFVVAQRTFQNIHRVFVVLLDGEDFFSGIVFICGGLKFDIRADGYRERRIATDEVCPIFPVGVVVFRGFYRVQKFVRDGVRNILVVYDIFVYRNRVFKTACAFRVAFFAVTES